MSAPVVHELRVGLLRAMLLAFAVVLFVFVACVVVLWLCLSNLGGLIEGVKVTGQLGDSFGALTCFFTALAFAAVAVSTWLQGKSVQSSLDELRLSVDAQQKLVEGAAHERLYDHNARWVEFLAQRPHLRKWFYDNHPLDAVEAADDQLLELAAELLCGYLELIAIQYPHIPNHIQPHWDKYVVDSFSKGRALRRYFNDHWEWYVPELVERAERAGWTRPNKPNQSVGDPSGAGA